MNDKDYADSKLRLEKLKKLTGQLCSISEKDAKNEKKKLDWTINYINLIIKKSKIKDFQKSDIVDLLEDIICVIEQDDDNDE